jgi:adenylylsulfate kinase
MSFKILVMGLSGSGKTTLAKQLVNKLKAKHLNADAIRDEYNDWDFSTEGRIRQAERLSKLASESDSDYVVIDFICPLEQGRKIINADYTIWMDTVDSSKYKDTDNIFEKPDAEDVHSLESLTYNVNNIMLQIIRIMYGNLRYLSNTSRAYHSYARLVYEQAS